MYPMMDTIGWNYGFIALWGLHVLSVVAFFTGVLFLIVLAVKTFTPAQLKSWAVWLMITGTIVCLITIAFIGRPWVGMNYWGAGMGGGGMQMQQMQMMGRMMEEMMEHDRGANGEEGEEHGDMMQMMRMMMGSQQGGGMMNSQGNGLDALQDEHHESSSSSSR